MSDKYCGNCTDIGDEESCCFTVRKALAEERRGREEAEAALSGRTVSCSQFNEAAKKLAELQAENNKLRTDGGIWCKEVYRGRAARWEARAKQTEADNSALRAQVEAMRGALEKIARSAPCCEGHMSGNTPSQPCDQRIASDALSSLHAQPLRDAERDVIEAAEELVDGDGWATGKTLDRLIAAFKGLRAARDGQRSRVGGRP